MAENPGDDGSKDPSVLKRACEPCRNRKIRCDKTVPCGVDCTPSRTVARPKQARVLISSQYERKIDLIEQRLDRLGDLVESLALHSSSSSERHHRKHSSAHSPRSRHDDIVVYPPQDGYGSFHLNEKDSILKGQSSLSAHSSFAVNFLHDEVDSKHEREIDSEMRDLLDTISSMVDAFNSQPLSPTLFPYARKEQNTARPEYEMPPIQNAVDAIREAQKESNVDLQLLNQFFSRFLRSQNILELCLSIYFSQDYSEAEFIIVNSALYSKQPAVSPNDEYAAMVSTCRANLETALSRLSLYTRPSYDMVLALVLGTEYAVESSKGSLASILAGAAFQSARSLGYHTLAVGTDMSVDEPNNKGMLFWFSYVLEKTLSLRNGQSSAILDITIPLPKESPSSNFDLLGYFRQMVKLALLAGRIYKELYRAGSLSLPVDVRRHRATALSQELQEHLAGSRRANGSWIRSVAPGETQDLLRSMAMSDEVLQLSMLTLIYRAMPLRIGASSTFNDECLYTARAALECHQYFILEFGTANTILLSGHVTWSILSVPFVPFIVLFCHSIETSDSDDLTRMQSFVTS
ncbi:hypothetical protein BDW62DRAFT_199554 [Aspergillus aurantiobrunneus]